MRWLKFVIVLLTVGCAPVADRPGNWVTADGHTLSDRGDYDDCLHKARYSELFASANEGPPLYGPPQRDRLMLDICLRAPATTRDDKESQEHGPQRDKSATECV